MSRHTKVVRKSAKATKVTRKRPDRPAPAGRTRAKDKANDAFNTGLLAGIEEGLEYARGLTHGERTVVYRGSGREAEIFAAPAFSGTRIAELRARIGQSQPIFALMLNVNVETVRAWEQGRRRPDSATLRLLQIAEESPEVLLRYVKPK